MPCLGRSASLFVRSCVGSAGFSPHFPTIPWARPHRRKARSLARPLILILALCPLSLARAADAPKVLWQTTLKERIGHEWAGELLGFEMPEGLRPDPARHRLMLVEGDTATELPFQVSGEETRVVECIVDLPPFARRTLRLEESPASKELVAPMPVIEKEDRLVIDNGALRIEIPRLSDKPDPTKQTPPPLLRVQNSAGGPWVGLGRFQGTGPLLSAAGPLLAGKYLFLVRGPVSSHAEYEYRFEKGAYDVTLHLNRGQPELLWDERFDFEGEGASLELDLSAGIELATGVWDYYRTKYPWRKTDLGVSKAYPLAAGGEEVTTFEPWIHWWIDDISTWIEMWDKEKNWAVGLFTGSPASWHDFAMGRNKYKGSPFRLMVTKERKTTLHLPLGELGVRTWGLSLAKRTPDKRIGPNTTVGPADTARRQIRLAENALQQVNRYVLDDATPPATYPLFTITKDDQKKLREAAEKDFPFLQSVKAAIAWAKTAKPLDDKGGFWHIGVPPDKRPWPPLPQRDVLARAALAGYAEPIQTHLRATVMRESLGCVEAILRHVTGPGMGIAPHNWMCSGPTEYLWPLVDMAMPYLTEKEREVLRARLLFLAYTLYSSNFWCPRLGLSANPNMTTLVYAELAFDSFLFPKHPETERWRKYAVDEMFHEVETWSGPNGGWLEAPHYATVALDHIVAIGYAMRNLGLGDKLIGHERLKKAIEWLAKISTPPDPRFKNLRHSPPIGNTWLYETSCLYSYMAKVWRDRDPEYANAMRWMWEQQGFPLYPGIGGAYPTTDGFREVLLDLTSSTHPPKWTSEAFPGSGVILRSGFPTDRETRLYLIQGKLHDHYDDDLGSFELWGKGRPLCGDFGYTGFDPAEHHNRVGLNGEGKIAAFSTQPAADFLHNQQGAWDRLILFVKDADPLGPNYFVVRDIVAKDAPRAGNWWLWMNTEEEIRRAHTEATEGTEKKGTGGEAQEKSQRGTRIEVKGREDVDLDLWFGPAGAPLLPVEGDVVKTTPLSVKTHSAGPPSTDQRGLKLVLAPGTSLVWLMYPRLRDEKPPAITTLGREDALKIETPAGTDYVFLAPAPIEFRAGEIEFDGTAGLIRVRPGKTTLALPCSGALRFGRFRLITIQQATKEFAP